MSQRVQRGMRVVKTLAAIIVVLVTGTVHARMDTTAQLGSPDRPIPSPEHARFASLGFRALVSDLYWLQVLQLVGGVGGQTASHSDSIARYVELVTGVDPWVDHPYRFAALWLTGDLESVQRANRLLERSVEYHPDEWRNWYYLGFNYFFFLEENAKAAAAMERAASLPRSPKFLGPLAARLRASTGSLDLAAKMLAAMVQSTDDEFAKAEHMKALDEVEVERRARFLDDARFEFWKRHGRDIHTVDELTAGEAPVLRGLPAAHPIFDGFVWEIEPDHGEIVSNFYGSRYELHTHPTDLARQSEWQSF